MTIKNDMAIIVISNDAYRDTWLPFSFFFKKHWPSCNYPVWLVSESLAPLPTENICFTNTLNLGVKPWSDLLLETLDKVEESCVLIVIGDFFLCEDINTDKLRKILNDCHSPEIGCIRIVSERHNKKAKHPIYTDSDYHEIVKKSIYRISTAPAIWDKNYLRSILKKGETPWQFERIGTIRSNSFPEKVLYTSENIYKSVHAIRKGKWYKSAIKYCKINNCPVDISLRPVKSIMETLYDFIMGFIFNLFPKITTYIQNNRMKKI